MGCMPQRQACALSWLAAHTAVLFGSALCALTWLHPGYTAQITGKLHIIACYILTPF